MKISRILSVMIMMAIAASCSKDDDEPQPQIEDASLSLSANSTVLDVPQALLSSNDTYAQMAASYVAMANGMSANLAMFVVPTGATKSTEPITPANGRVAESGALIYKWEDQDGNEVAYQVRDAGDKYTFELFFKSTGETEWYRYLYAEELKDRSSGHMALYDIWGFMGDAPDQIMTRWDWTRKGDQFTFKMHELDMDFSFTVTVNTKTKAGSLVYFNAGLKETEVIWDAQGKGSWKEFDETGAVIEEGTWG